MKAELTLLGLLCLKSHSFGQFAPLANEIITFFNNYFFFFVTQALDFFISVLGRRPIKNFTFQLDSGGVSQHKHKVSVWPKSHLRVLTMEVILEVDKCVRN